MKRKLPYVTTEQMIEVDRLMEETYHIDLIQMMENAGRHLARTACDRLLAGDPRGLRVVVLAGTGGNGGGAIVAARRLAGWGAMVQVYTTAEDERLTLVPARQVRAIRQIGIPVATIAEGLPTESTDAIVDGLVGYNLRGAPTGPAALGIEWANERDVPVISLDVPSGLDATSGLPSSPCVRAVATLTLALPKTGLREERALPYVGELYLADIGVPPTLYAQPSLSLDVGPIFAREEVLRLR